MVINEKLMNVRRVPVNNCFIIGLINSLYTICILAISKILRPELGKYGVKPFIS